MIEKPTDTHIIKWHDGQDAWSMTIKPGSVSFKTTAANVPADALETHGKAWTEAFAFINGAFDRAKHLNG